MPDVAAPVSAGLAPVIGPPNGLGRVSWVDAPIGMALAALTLAISVFFAPRGYQAGFVDMAHDGYQLREILDLSEGAVIFRDTFDQYGPGGGYLNTVGFLALGRRLLAVKYFVCAWYALIAGTLFAFARQWLRPGLAGFSVIVWLGLAPFYQHGIMISPHVYVLFLQTLATIVAAGGASLDPRRFALVGVLTGLSWSMKQSMGVLFLAAILAYLACHVVARDRSARTRTMAAAAAAAIGFFSVIGIVLALLWINGALPDWYRQTIVFPRELYLQEYSHRLGSEGPRQLLARMLPPVAAEFVRLQIAQAPYWLVIRAAVLVAAFVQLCRGWRDDRLILIASITAFLWLGAFPSANFMHQWWTASLAIPPFVWTVHQMTTRVAAAGPIRAVCTILIVLVVVGAGMAERRRATAFRASSLTETLVDPPVLRGIRTDAPMKRAFDALYGVMSRFRRHHPGTRLVAIDAADQFWSGINESLPFLSAFAGNSHSHPVYWNLPVLSTSIYPGYAETLWREIRTDRPLLIEHRAGAYKPQHLPGYALLAAVESDFGYWYLYGPDHADRALHGELSLFLARDGSTDAGFAENGTAPKVDTGLSPSAEGALRGTVARTGGVVSLYTWPADLPLLDARGPVEPLPPPSFRDRIARQLADGTWVVDGQARGRFESLLEFVEEDVPAGTTLIVRGELLEGGLQVGFVQQNQWGGFITVTGEGPFEAVLEIQRSGRYRLVLANCIESTPWQRARRHWLGGIPGLFTSGFMPNRFRISDFGLIRRQ
jgi:Dolichyl-phosphate-mannose-protein mannosyltransferase